MTCIFSTLTPISTVNTIKWYLELLKLVKQFERSVCIFKLLKIHKCCVITEFI